MDDAALADLHELNGVGVREDDLFDVVVLFDHLSLLRQRLEEPSSRCYSECLAWTPDGRSLVPDKRKRS